MADLKQALATIRSHLNGSVIDVLAFDACLMSSAEVAANLSGYVQYLVASETISFAWSRGLWPWNEDRSFVDWESIIKNMERLENMAPAEVAAAIVDNISAQVTGGSLQSKTHAWAVTDINLYASSVMPAFEDFAAAMRADLPSHRAELEAVRKDLDSYEGPFGHNYDRIVDLYQLAQDVVSANVSASLKSKAQYLVNALRSAVSETFVHQGTDVYAEAAQQIHGISINWPESGSEYEAIVVGNEQKVYELGNQLALVTEWDEFLHDYLGLPKAVDDAFVVPANGGQVELPVLDNDTDPNGGKLSVDYWTIPVHGTLDKSYGKLYYTPNSGYVSGDTFVYSISNTGVGTSWATVTISIGNNPVPNAPTAVTASDNAFTNRVHVTWSLVSNATAYEVWRNTINNSSSAEKLSLVQDVDCSSYDDTTATAGVDYWYWIKAKNTVGTSCFSAATKGCRAQQVVMPAPPSAVFPTSGAFPDKVQVAWIAVGNAASYSVWRSTANDSSTATGITAQDATRTTYDDTTAAAGTSYWYWVKASNSAGTSNFSSSGEGQVASQVVVPNAPTGVSASDATFGDEVQVAWNAVANAATYSVWRSTNNDPLTAALVSTQDVAGTVYDDMAAGAEHHIGTGSRRQMKQDRAISAPQIRDNEPDSRLSSMRGLMLRSTKVAFSRAMVRSRILIQRVGVQRSITEMAQGDSR